MRKSVIILSVLLSAANAHGGWTPAVRISDEVPSLRPRIVADGDTLHVVYWTWTGTARAYYLRSLNGGDIWNASFRLGDSLIAGSDSSPLICNIRDTVVTIWHQNLPGGGRYNLGFRLSTNGGNSWGIISYILPNDFYEIQTYAFCNSNVDLDLISGHIDQFEILVEFTKSTNLGDTWTTPTEIFRTQETGQIDVAARGDTIHCVWVGRFDYDDEWEIYYTRSENGGQDWTDNLMLSTLDNRAADWPSLTFDEDGNIAVFWMDYKYSPNLWRGDLFVRYSFNGGDDWTDEEQITFTHDALYPHIIWRGDSIHVAWEDWRYNQADIFYMLSEDNGLTWGVQQRIEDDPGMSLAPDLALSGENVHVVWRQDSGMNGPGIYYSRWENESAVGDYEESQLPEDLILRAYPNPFNSKTLVTYKNLKGGEIEIYNINGQKIRTFKMSEIKEGQIEWDARDALGNKVTSGIYFARARGGRRNSIIKLVYLK